MFTWIFIWTPALEMGSSMPINLGRVFSTYFVGVMCGSSVFRLDSMDLDLLAS